MKEVKYLNNQGVSKIVNQVTMVIILEIKVGTIIKRVNMTDQETKSKEVGKTRRDTKISALVSMYVQEKEIKQVVVLVGPK